MAYARDRVSVRTMKRNPQVIAFMTPFPYSVDVDAPLKDAHAVSHQVKDRLMDRYPQIMDAIIHIEPPPRLAGSR